MPEKMPDTSLLTVKDPNLLQGTQAVVNPIVPVPRVDQTMVLPRAIKPRHLERGLFSIHQGLDADLSSTDGLIYPFFFAVDSKKLYAWTGTAWVSVTLS